MTTAVVRMTVEGINPDQAVKMLEDFVGYARQCCGGMDLRIEGPKAARVSIDADRLEQFEAGLEMLLARRDPDETLPGVLNLAVGYCGP